MWIREASDVTERNQELALKTTFLITKHLGPSCIELLKPGENATVLASTGVRKKTIKYRVRIGETHSCTCKAFVSKPSSGLCLHICWALLKYLKLTIFDARSWQNGLPYRDIEALLSEKDAKPDAKAQDKIENSEGEHAGDSATAGREITVDDVCPICQESLLASHRLACHCGECKQNMHVHCMKVWCDHQTSTSDDSIPCPMCRGHFSTVQAFRKLVHAGVTANSSTSTKPSKKLLHDQECDNCNTNPIQGRLYKCNSCPIFLCAACFTNGCHPQDGDDFMFKIYKNGAFRTARKRFKRRAAPHIDETTVDRETLLQLDEPELQRAYDIPSDPLSMPLPSHIVNLIPSFRIKKPSHKLLKTQCILCLKQYQMDTFVRKLACGHYFHRNCVDGFLLEDYQTCPVCGNKAYRESVHKKRVQRPLSGCAGDASSGIGAGRAADMRLALPARPVSNLELSGQGFLPSATNRQNLPPLSRNSTTDKVQNQTGRVYHGALPKRTRNIPVRAQGRTVSELTLDIRGFNLD